MFSIETEDGEQIEGQRSKPLPVCVLSDAPTVRVSPGRIRAPFGDDMRDPPPHVGCMLAVVLVLLFALAWYSVI